MKVILEIPDKTANFAVAALHQVAAEHETERINAAFEQCKNVPVILDKDDIDGEEGTELFVAIAMLAVGKEVDKLPKEKSALSKRLEQMQKERQEIIEQQNSNK